MMVEVQPRKRATGAKADDGTLIFSLPADLARELKLATGEVPYLLNHAANVFDLIFSVSAAGFNITDSGLHSICELCARALHHAADKEGEAISLFDQVLREALADQSRAAATKPEIKS